MKKRASILLLNFLIEISNLQYCYLKSELNRIIMVVKIDQHKCIRKFPRRFKAFSSSPFHLFDGALTL